MSTFDQAFQEQVAAFYLRDDQFVAAAGGLVLPDYFENETLAALVAVQGEYLKRYNQVCTLKTYIQVLQRMVTAKRVKIADMNEAKRLLAVLHRDPLKDRQFVIDTIVDFARHQALLNATLEVADALDTFDPQKIGKALVSMEEAKSVGASDVGKAVDFKATLKQRVSMRALRAAGTYNNMGITTGDPELDARLTPHRGWGRKELSILMGPPKSGKTAGLISFAVAAATAGHKVFYASCEVSDEVIGDRSDSNISGVPLKQLETRAAEVEKAVEDWVANPGTGELIVEAFPIRTLKVSELRRILKRYQGQGIEFDMVVVDYGDIMKPETAYDQKRHGLAEIYQDLRALATDFNCAMLTATQTNREGTKKAGRNVTDGTDAADDYEKVRTADVLITINHSEDDWRSGEVVLYFSEMRNTESGIKMRFKQDMSCMRFLDGFLSYD